MCGTTAANVTANPKKRAMAGGRRGRASMHVRRRLREGRDNCSAESRQTR